MGLMSFPKQRGLELTLPEEETQESEIEILFVNTMSLLPQEHLTCSVSTATTVMHSLFSQLLSSALRLPLMADMGLRSHLGHSG